jgi:hypothetical protein
MGKLIFLGNAGSDDGSACNNGKGGGVLFSLSDYNYHNN